MFAEIQKADHVVTISDTTLNNLLELKIVNPSKCSCIPLGVEPISKLKKIINEKIEPILNLKYILFVGALEMRKNLEHLLTALLHLNDFHLVIAGSPGFGFKESIEPLLKKFPKQRLHLLQNVERSDIAYLYESAFATLYPTWEEGFGLPILEAMVHGSPIITSNRSANAEVGGDAAILVNPENPSESTEAIMKLQENEEFRKKKIADGFIHAKKYSWQTYTERLYNLYSSLL